MSDESRWQRTEPPARGPSAPPGDRFDPLATGIGVFTAITIPIIVLGGPDTVVIVIGVVVGLLVGLIAGLWVNHRDGQVWRGPRL